MFSVRLWITIILTTLYLRVRVILPIFWKFFWSRHKCMFMFGRMCVWNLVSWFLFQVMFHILQYLVILWNHGWNRRVESIRFLEDKMLFSPCNCLYISALLFAFIDLFLLSDPKSFAICHLGAFFKLLH